MKVYIVVYYDHGDSGVDSVHRRELSALVRARELNDVEVSSTIIEREMNDD